jgi:hypothetical protein
MALDYMNPRRSRLESRERDRAEYKMIFFLGFALFLVGALLARAVRLLQIPFFGPRPPRKSLVAEAREAANSILPYAFMG